MDLNTDYSYDTSVAQYWVWSYKVPALSSESDTDERQYLYNYLVDYDN